MLIKIECNEVDDITVVCFRNGEVLHPNLYIMYKSVFLMLSLIPTAYNTI